MYKINNDVKKCYEFVLSKEALYKDWKTIFWTQIKAEEK